MKFPLTHRVYRLTRPILQRWHILKLARRYLSPQLRTQIAIRLGLAGFDVSSAQPRRLPPYLHKRAQLQASAGVNYVGDLRSPSGLGEYSRRLVQAMQQADIPIAYHELRYHPGLQSAPSPLAEATAWPHRINLYDIHVGYFLDAVLNLPRNAVEGRRAIACWFWELAHCPPQWQRLFPLVDEVWVASEHIRSAFTPHSACTVTVVPPVIHLSSAKAQRQHFGFPEGRLIFGFNFDALSSIARKNPFGLLKAWRMAFSGESNPPLLVLKSTPVSPKLRAEWWDALRREVASLGAMWYECYWDRATMDAWLASIDAYVSLHRAEGFGFGMAEAMTHAKPVVATAWSGNMDYMDSESAYLVPAHLRAISINDHAQQPYFASQYPSGEWAEPDLEAAAHYLRLIASDYTSAQRVGMMGKQRIAQQYSAQLVMQTIRDRLALHGLANHA